MGHSRVFLLTIFCALPALVACGGASDSKDGGGQAVISFSVSSLDFGQQAVDTNTAPKSVTLTNAGDARLEIYSISLSAGFSGTHNCPGRLSSGRSCSIEIKFSPTSAGYFTGYLTITSNSVPPSSSVTLLGQALAVGAAGVWRSKVASGGEFVALVTDDGEIRLMDSLGEVYAGSFGQRSAWLTGAYNEAEANGPDEGGILSVVVQGPSRSTVESGGAAVASSLVIDLVFVETTRAAGLANLAGTYNSDATNSVLTIDSSGRLFAQDPTTGCVIEGHADSASSGSSIFRITYRSVDCVAGKSFAAEVLGTLDARDTQVMLQMIGGDSLGQAVALLYRRM